ncbi:MAG: response regulator transcription factor [Spirochaetia bacterium]|nr:response regulator transcription factor [Spirochaetia bacterium]
MKQVICLVDRDLDFLKRAETHFSGDVDIDLKTFSSPDLFWKEFPTLHTRMAFINSELDGGTPDSVWAMLGSRAPDVHRVMLTDAHGEELIAQAIRSGGSGCLPKKGPELIRSAIQLVLHGGTVVAPSVAVKVAQDFKGNSEEAAKDRLTPREKELLALMVQGMTMQKAGNSMGISINTVRSHIKSVYRKLEVHDKSALFRRARAMGLL